MSRRGARNVQKRTALDPWPTPCVDRGVRTASWMLFIVGVVALAARPARADKPADVVVVAELLRGSSAGACGVLAVVGEYEYRVIAVEKGKVSADRISVWALCPEMSHVPYHISRLRLSTHKRFSYRPTSPLRDAPATHLWLVKQEVVTRDYGKYLGGKVDALDRDFTYTTTKKGWRNYGIALAAQIANGRVVALRLLSPPGFPRAFPWLGASHVTWSRYRHRGGYSQGTFVDRDAKLAGEASGGRIVLRRAP